MQSSLKKSLYLGLAALSFGAVATVSTTASAKSYAKAGAYSTLKAAATDRNVEATGTNALYTKPGTVKGAKVVASEAKMAELATSKKSANYFRAYGTKTTNRGSVYYRVVTMDQKYRGYVYGGKVADTFGGGIKKAETTTANTTDTNIGKTVYFANPGKTNVTWTAPKYTQYKSGASKNVVSTQPFSGDTLKITKAETKTREGSLYYYVEDQTHPSVSGWIYNKAVTDDASVAFNQATDVKVNFVNDGKTVASGILQDLKADGGDSAANAVGTSVGTDATSKVVTTSGSTTTTTAWTNKALKGSGYTYDFSNANAAALLAAKTGDTITLNVKAGNQVTTPLYFYKSSGDVTSSATQLTVFQDATKTPANAETIVLPTLTTGFKGVSGADYTSADLNSFATTNKLTNLYTPTYKTSDGNNAYTEYTLVSAQAGTYSVSGQAQLVYTAKEYTNATSPVGDGTTNSTQTDTGQVVGDNPTTTTTVTPGADSDSSK